MLGIVNQIFLTKDNPTDSNVHDSLKVMGSNPGYILKSSLLYQKIVNKLDFWLIRTSTIHNRVHELLGIIKWIWIAECVYNHVLYSTLHSLKALWVIRNVSNQICYSYQLQERTIFLTDSVTSNFWTFLFWHHSFSMIYALSLSYLISCKLVEKWQIHYENKFTKLLSFGIN